MGPVGHTRPEAENYPRTFFKLRGSEKNFGGSENFFRGSEFFSGLTL